MPRALWTRPLAAGLAALLLAACATTHLPPISVAGRDFAPEGDELALWAESRAEEERLLGAARLYDDPELAVYLDELLVTLAPPGLVANREIELRAHVLADPTLNAFAYPHGSLYLHTGILARVEDEAQLATVIAHELSHVEGRHLLRHRRAAQNREIGFTIAAVAASVILAEEVGEQLWKGDWGEAALLDLFGQLAIGLGLQLALVASVNGYGRDLEREADDGAIRMLRHAGYDLAAAPRVYQALLDDHGERTSGLEQYFFGSHPRLEERVARSREVLRTHPPEAAPRVPADPDRFARLVAPLVRDNAGMNLELGRLELAGYELERARRAMPGDAETRYLLGLLALARAEEAAAAGSEAEAAAYRDDARGELLQAAALAPGAGHAGAHRELAHLALGDGDRAGACAHLRSSLDADPEQESAADLADLLDSLFAEGVCP